VGSGQTAAIPAPGQASGARVRRAAAVGGAWALAGASLAFGWPRCLIASLFGVSCPTCGVTRALRLLASGQYEASLRMHPLAVPTAIALALFALATIDAALEPRPALAPRSALEPRPALAGARRAFGRAALALLAVVYAAAIALWIARAFGYAGGPVPVV
jgi:Protein of unknown function (DUF2752)